MNNSKAWILTIAFVAFGMGAVLYYFTILKNFDQASSVEVPPVSTDSDSRESQFIFNEFDTPRTLPELNFVDGEGRDLSLQSFRGKLVLLNIWATWCVPCRKEMPTLDRLQAKLGGPDFEVVALSIDRAQVEVIKDFYEETGLKSLAIYHDSTGGASYKLNVPGIPATLLVNRDGKELARVIGPAEWDSPEVIKEIRNHLPPNLKESVS